MAPHPVRAAAALLVFPMALVPAAARADEPPPLPAPPDATAAPAVDGGQRVLGPGEALALALQANPSLRASLRELCAARAEAEAASASRMPAFVASGSGSVNENIAGTAAGAVRTRSSTVTESIGLRYTTAVGTVLSLDLSGTTQWREVNRDPSTTTLFLIGPTHAAQMVVQARQPLLRGAGRDAVLAAERQAEVRAEAASLDTAQASSQLVVDVLTAYWELWRAERALEVEHRAVTLAEQQWIDAQRRAQLGTLAPADVLRFATERAARAQASSLAATSVVARTLELARLLGAPLSSASQLVTEDAPPEEPPPFALPSLTAALVRSSPALASLAADVEAARVQYAASVDATQARLDLTGSAGVAGLWTDDAFQGWALPGGRPAVVASVGLELELPLVASVTRARRAAARATLDAAELRLEAEIARVEATLASVHAELEGARARIRLAGETAELASLAAEAERGRNAIGTSTPTALLEAQQNERTSRLEAMRTRVDAELAALRVAHAAGVLLDRFSLAVPEGGSR